MLLCRPGVAEVDEVVEAIDDDVDVNFLDGEKSCNHSGSDNVVANFKKCLIYFYETKKLSGAMVTQIHNHKRCCSTHHNSRTSP